MTPGVGRTNPEPAFRPTVAWVIQGDETFGVRRAVLSLAGAAREAGWRVILAAIDGGPFADECRGLGYDVRPLGLGRAPAFFGNPAAKALGLFKARAYRRRAVRAIVGSLAADRPDVVHVLWPNLVALAGQAARRLGAACTWELVNIVGDRLPFSLNRRYYQWLCRRHGIRPLANSRHSARSLGDRPVRPVVMHLGTDPATFRPTLENPVTRAELGIPLDAVVFAIFARLEPVKGQDRLAAALAAVANDAAGVSAAEPSPGPIHLLLVGAGADDAYRRQIISAAGDGMAGRVHLIGNVPDPQRYYPAVVDVAVNWSTSAEPFGLSVIEAMMAGRPVLAHAAGGPAETVVDGVTGWHGGDASVQTLTAVVRRALADRSRWPTMGAAARAHAVENFSIERQFATYAGVVEEVLDARRGGG